MKQSKQVLLGLGLVTLSLSSLGFNSYSSKVDRIQKGSEALTNQTRFEHHQALTRWNHAKELLGRNYARSIVKSGEHIIKIDEVVAQWTRRALPAKWKNSSDSIAQTILSVSYQYGFDPIFVLAIIENESSFNPGAVGPVGEIGLMQLRPQTAEWISKIAHLPWKGAKSLNDPATNIRIGTAYLSYLREEFDSKGQLYMAAYNMGSTNVRRAVGRRVLPKVYSTNVMRRYVKFYTRLNAEVNKTL